MSTPPSPSEHDIEATAERWFARLDAGLSPAEAAEFARWQAADPRHVAAVAEIRAMWKQLGRPRRLGAAAAVGREFTRLQRRRRRRRLGWTLAGLTVVMVSGLLIPRERTEPLFAEATSSIVVWPQRRTLPDGSLVELKDQAELEVDFTTHSEGARRVTLQHGEAHFQVARDVKRPFIVTAGAVEVRAVGTAFAVSFADQGIEVVVTEGRVAVAESYTAAPSALAELPSVYAEAGNRVIVPRREPLRVGSVQMAAPAMEVVPLSATEVSKRLSWRSVRAEFSRTPLAEVVRVVNQHSRIQFTIADPELAGVSLSGIFRADDGEALARSLEGSFAIQAERRSPTEIFLRRMP